MITLAVLAVAGVVLLWPRPNRITRENFLRIRDGMSRADVEAILGPPGDYTTGPVRFGDSHIISPWNVNATRPLPDEKEGFSDWLTDTGWFCVVFDDSGKVAARGFDSCTKLQQSPLDNLLWRAKRQWHRWFP